MNAKEQELHKLLLATFREEAREHLDVMKENGQLLSVANDERQRQELIEILFRETHSMKGAARAVNLNEIERVCQLLETAFAALRRSELSLSTGLVVVVQNGIQLLGELQANMEDASVEKPPVGGFIKSLEDIISGRMAAPSMAAPVAVPVAEPAAAPAVEQPGEPRVRATADSRTGNSVRVPTEKLEGIRLHAEELLLNKLSIIELSGALTTIRGRIGDRRKEWTRGKTLAAGVSTEKSRDNHLLADWLEANSAFLSDLEDNVSKLANAANLAMRSLASRVDRLLDDSGSMLMLPSSWLLDGIRPIVSGLAADQKKNIRLRIEGEHVEIDRRILTDIREPLIHILRNCVDHGIERPAERAAANKPEEAILEIRMFQTRARKVEILIRDDGRGIDPQKVKNAALKLGILDAKTASTLSDSDAVNLVFKSEVSTSPVITDISGRGLGLAIVWEKIEKLGGTVSLESERGRGTTIRIELPLLLSTFRGVVVRAAGALLVIPTNALERVLLIGQEEVKTLEGRETISYDGMSIPVARLGDVLGLKRGADVSLRSKRLHVILIQSAGTRFAFVVDEIFQEQEVAVKGLGAILEGHRGVSGATILGNGQVASVLEVADLVQAGIRAGEAGGLSVAANHREVAKHKILVAEDSITSRTLLKGILEANGFLVETAVDGMDAFGKLRDGEFDLVVSDVDMPRLNGIGLTSKIRSDKKLAEIPVVLVTSLDSMEDRERGLDVGASAYIVKSSFEQSSLLQVIRRLL